MKTVFRLSKEEYSKELSCVGASIYGGRWNSKGFELIYTSESRALALSELLVHLPIGLLPNNYKIITIGIPENLNSQTIEISTLPTSWNSFPFTENTKSIGNNFILANNKPILRVPSAIISEEYNYLINPHHKDFKKIKILSVEDFIFNDRLFR